MRRATAFALAVLIAACSGSAPRTEGDLVRYRDPEGRFSMAHPRGWPQRITHQDGVSFWRWTPEALSSPDASAPADLMFAFVPLPPIPETQLRDESLEEVGEYVRDILIMSARDEGADYVSAPGRRFELGDRDAIRFDLSGASKDGVEARITAIVVNVDGGAAAVVSFGGTVARLAKVGPLLERSVASLRLGD